MTEGRTEDEVLDDMARQRLARLHERIESLEAQLAAAKGLPTDGEICQSCGSAVAVVWAAKDADWRKVVGGPGGLLCPRCFADKAEGRGIALAYLAVPLTDGWRTEWYDAQARLRERDGQVAALLEHHVVHAFYDGCSWPSDDDVPAAAKDILAAAEREPRLREALKQMMNGFSHGGSATNCSCQSCDLARAALETEAK